MTCSESPEGISYPLFADDGVVWKAGSNLTEVLLEMQESLNRVEEWSHSWGLTVSPKKTKAMIVARKRKIHPSKLEITGKRNRIYNLIQVFGCNIG